MCSRRRLALLLSFLSGSASAQIYTNFLSFWTKNGSSGGTCPTSPAVITAGTSCTVSTPGTLTVWAVGGGGGGAGSTNVTTVAGGGGGAGGVAYYTIPVTTSTSVTLNYSIGAGGAGAVDAYDGSAGSATTISVSTALLIANGGAGGLYNTGVYGAGGSYSGGSGGAIGGYGAGATGNAGGGTGGALGGVTGSVANGGVAGVNPSDINGLFAVLTAAGYSTSGAGASGGNSVADQNHGGNATGFGASGGGPGRTGGNGGSGYFGGGGAGAAGNAVANMLGGNGGAGAVVYQITNTPNAFAFTDQIGVTTNTTITSNTVTLSSGFAGVTATCGAGCTAISRNGGAFSAGPVGGFGTGDTIAIRQLSSVTVATTTTASVTVGTTTSSIWSVMTACYRNGTDPIGTLCEDGTVYAGLSPDGNVPMFTTKCDVGLSWTGSSCAGSASTNSWNDSTSNWTPTDVTSTSTGATNTASLVALGTTSTPAPYNAARACSVDSAGTAGYSDWYLPAKDELNVLRTNRTAIGNFASTNYWSSTEANKSASSYQTFPGGTQGASSKSSTYRLRCVRTDGTVGAFAFQNQSGVTVNTTITSNTVTLAGSFSGVTATCGSGCTAISRNGGAFAASPVGGFNSGDTIAIRQTSSSAQSTATTASVTVGTRASVPWQIKTTGWSTKSLDFDGNSDRVTLSSLQTLMGTTAVGKMSVSLWLKAATASPSTYETPIGAATASSWADGFGFYWSSTTLYFWVNVYSLYRISTVTVPDVWNHAVGVFDKTLANGNMVLYLNGSSVGVHDLAGVNVTGYTNTVSIGDISTQGYNFAGRVDDVAIWSSALSSAEVTAIYNGGKPADLRSNFGNYTSSANLKSYWYMGDGDSGTTILDHKGSTNGTRSSGLTDYSIVNDTP